MRTMLLMVVTVLVLCVGLLFAEEVEDIWNLKSEHALVAKAKYDTAVKEAQRKYQEDMGKLKLTFVQELEIAAKDAGKAGNLDEAIKIRAAKERLIGTNEPEISNSEITALTDPNINKSSNRLKGLTNKRFYGLRLGENFPDLQRRLKLTREDNYGAGSIQDWKLTEPPIDLDACYAQIYENKVCGIAIKFKDASSNNSEMIKKELTKKYGEPTYNGLGVLTKYSAKIDNIETEITLLFDGGKNLLLCYYDTIAIDKRTKEIEKRKKENIEKNL